ncbi:MAG: phosphoribosyl-ATP diphosphatase [Ruminococcus sp.]|jgi:phosphoribosyl-ATP pyrophosphohydrolase|nr:phosphoribosyl-ATP diphosphatase [Ruminococcus sp.]
MNNENNVFQKLESVVIDRKENKTEGSYTCYLFEKGVDKILKKCGEECSEMLIAAKNNDNIELKNEISDLLYHITVLCVNQGLPFSEVLEVLSERANKVGNLKQFTISDKNS